MKIPDILYKYRDWNNPYHKDCLIKNTIFIPSPNQFNDPFDCRISVDFALHSLEEREFYIEETLRYRILPLRAANRETFDYEAEKIKLSSLLKNTEQLSIEMDNLRAYGFNEHYGILSLSERWDSIAMWAYYADSHKGFCIGFNTERLIEEGDFGQLGPINYTEICPVIKPKVYKPGQPDLMKDSFTALYSKSVEWVHEKEFRLTKIFENVASNKDRITYISNECIAEIILGVFISETDKIELLNICKEKKIQVYQTRLVRKKFELYKERLN